MKTTLALLLCILALAATLLSTGCDHASAAGSPNSPAGKNCTIQFRRDALGAAANLPISPTTDNINGAETSISGTYSYATDDWVVLNRMSREVWIPKSVILLIQFR